MSYLLNAFNYMVLGGLTLMVTSTSALELDRALEIEIISHMRAALERHGDEIYYVQLEPDEQFGELIRHRYDCLHSTAHGEIQGVHNSIFRFLGGGKNDVLTWNDGRYLWTGGAAHKNPYIQGIIIVDLQEAEFVFALYHSWDIGMTPLFQSGQANLEENDGYDNEGFISVFMSPNVSNEFKQEALVKVTQWANYFKTETVEKVLAGKLPDLVNELNGGPSVAFYTQPPSFDIYKITCDLDPKAAEKWDQLMAERNQRMLDRGKTKE